MLLPCASEVMLRCSSDCYVLFSSAQDISRSQCQQKHAWTALFSALREETEFSEMQHAGPEESLSPTCCSIDSIYIC